MEYGGESVKRNFAFWPNTNELLLILNLNNCSRVTIQFDTKVGFKGVILEKIVRVNFGSNADKEPVPVVYLYFEDLITMILSRYKSNNLCLKYDLI